MCYELGSNAGEGSWVRSSSAALATSRHSSPDRDERRINDERSQDCGVGWRNHTADTRGETPADEPGSKRKCGMTW